MSHPHSGLIVGEKQMVYKKKGETVCFGSTFLFLFELQSEVKREKQPSEAASVRGGSL